MPLLVLLARGAKPFAQHFSVCVVELEYFLHGDSPPVSLMFKYLVCTRRGWTENRVSQ